MTAVVPAALEPYLQGYGINATRIRQDVAGLRGRFANLVPSGDTFHENDGRQQRLLKFVGTVPIVYRGQTYHIPLTIWLPSHYPHVQPNIYVTPTADMAIKPHHANVDADGRCSLPALAHWSPHSSLLTVVGELQALFAVHPPVYAKPQGAPAMRPPSNPYNIGSHPSSSAGNPPFSSSLPPASSSSDSSVAQVVKRQVTERVSKECREVAEQMASFMATQSVLEEGSLEIDAAVSKMQEHKRQLALAIEWTRKATNEIDGWLAEQAQGMHSSDQVDVDQIVIPTSAMAGQLLEAVAAEKAIEDAIYCLNKAMYSDDISIDCESFTKEMRKLCTAQYMELALIRKIHAQNAPGGSGGDLPV